MTVISSVGIRFFTLPGQPTRRFIEDAYGFTMLRIAEDYLRSRQPDLVVSGAARGFDLIMGYAARTTGTPYEVVLPHENFSKGWDDVGQRYFDLVVDGASRIHTLAKGGYSLAKVKRRMVQKIKMGDRLVVLWDEQTPGYTQEAVHLAYSLRKEVDNLWRDFVEQTREISLYR